MNSLFPDEPQNDDTNISSHTNKHANRPGRDWDNPAVAMIRRKIEALYLRAPSAKQESDKVLHTQPPRTKHQEFMYRLTTSGTSMADIQTAWYDYYANLNDQQKHEVWQEFYSANAHHQVAQTAEAAHQTTPPETHTPKPVVMSEKPARRPKKIDRRSVATIKKGVLARIKASHNAQIKAKQHAQSLAFGVGLGALVLLIFLFGLFNELVITPFIRPSSNVAETPIILSSSTPAPSESPELIIPKINVQLPLIYGAQSVAEKDVQTALEDGVFHYPTTAVPGQNGNAAYFGHSSNNIFNKGKYKFAFVLLKELEPGDIFYLTYEGKVYTYKVYKKSIVNPEDTWVLGAVEGKTATATLITCDPPGTTQHRLVVWGEQISPDPGGNTVASAPSPALQTQDLPGKGPSAWTRFWDWATPF